MHPRPFKTPFVPLVPILGAVHLSGYDCFPGIGHLDPVALFGWSSDLMIYFCYSKGIVSLTSGLKDTASKG